jgi:hypothetical protein
MESLAKKDKELFLKMETEGLSSTQIRLIKNIHSLLAAVVTSEEEGEYFEASAELVKKAAELIKHSNFPITHKNISYGDQAVEFAIDSVNESMNENKMNNFDN